MNDDTMSDEGCFLDKLTRPVSFFLAWYNENSNLTQWSSRGPFFLEIEGISFATSSLRIINLIVRY